MAATTDLYSNNPLIHRDRRLGQSPSPWVRSFACEDLKPLIVCRGPIRKEAMDVFEEMGITHYGILLSEKDSIVYPNALAPELRQLTDNRRIHRVPDYSGATKEERVERMQQIVQIAHDNGYDSVFAGYGFMAEDEEFVATLEKAGLKFIGPNSVTQARAGKKDEAKRTALEVKVSVTPGVNDVAARTLLAKHPTREQLLALVKAEELALDPKVLADPKKPLVELADAVLMASYAKGRDLYSIDELGEQVRKEVVDMFTKYPQSRVRLKAIGGGGGKGQRILGGALLTRKDADKKAVEEAAAEAPAMVREVLNEVKANGVGDNKNVLVELNIEQTRHNEIQLVGNGKWCVALGGRDCSLQMHEQKLLEISVTQEGLTAAIEPRRGRPGRRGQGPGHGSGDPEADGGRRGPLRRGGRPRLGVHLRVHRRPGPLLLHGGEHPHPGGAPGHRALLQPEVPEPRRPERLLRRRVPGRGHGAARPPQGAAPQAHPRPPLRRRGRGASQRHRRLALPARRRRHPLLVEAHPRRDPRRPGHQPGESRHRHVHAVPGGGSVRLQHRAPPHRREGPAGQLPEALRRDLAAPACAASDWPPTSSSTTGS